MDASSPFAFAIESIQPIGLDGDSQRPMHTNVAGRILRGAIAVGDLVRVPLVDGGSMVVAVKWLMVEFGAAERSPQMLSAAKHGSYECGMSLRVPPDEAGTIDPRGLVVSARE